MIFIISLMILLIILQFLSWQVEQALTLISSGTITISMTQNSTTPRLPKRLNKSTGKESNREAAFCNTGNEEGWGLATWSCAKSAHSLSDWKFDKIQKLAMEHVKPTTRNHGSSSDYLTNDDTTQINDNDEWAHLAALDDSEVD